MEVKFQKINLPPPDYSSQLLPSLSPICNFWKLPAQDAWKFTEILRTYVNVILVNPVRYGGVSENSHAHVCLCKHCDVAAAFLV